MKYLTRDIRMYCIFCRQRYCRYSKILITWTNFGEFLPVPRKKDSSSWKVPPQYLEAFSRFVLSAKKQMFPLKRKYNKHKTQTKKKSSGTVKLLVQNTALVLTWLVSKFFITMGGQIYWIVMLTVYSKSVDRKVLYSIYTLHQNLNVNYFFSLQHYEFTRL